MSALKSIAGQLLARLLAWAAKRVLLAQQPLVVGVTGSVGKTTTREAIGAVLRETVKDRRVIVAPGNLNTEFGLPLAVLGLAKPEGPAAWLRTALTAFARGAFPAKSTLPVVYVLEYGLQNKGDMKQLLSIVTPDIGVLTNVGTVHFGDVAITAREKGQLIQALPPTGIAILNQDDKHVAGLATKTKAEVVLVRGIGKELSAAIAVEVAQRGFGVTRKDAQQALKHWKPFPGRLSLLPGIRGAWLLDDTYNANPQSVTLALTEVKRLAKAKNAQRIIVALGDMLELGPDENRAHKGIGLLAERVADHVVLVGPRFRRTKLGTVWFPGPQQAADYLVQNVQRGDIILVKGSESMRMEKVSEALLLEKRRAAELLTRQTARWKKKPYVAP